MSKGRFRAVLLMSLLGCGGVSPKPFGVEYDGGVSNVEDPTGGHGQAGHGGAGGAGQTGGDRTGGRGGLGGVAASGGQAGHGGKGGGQGGNVTTTGGAMGGSLATGGRATGGATGGLATGGAATGGMATGGVATGGTATGGAATGGVATGGMATGGTATGGTGTGGTGVRTCKQIAADYDTALVAAKACILTAVSSCAKVAPDALGCNPCDTPVQDDTTLTALRKEWKAQECASSLLCPAVLIKCVYPPNATGVCQSDLVSTNEPSAIAPIRVRGTCVWQSGATTN